MSHSLSQPFLQPIYKVTHYPFVAATRERGNQRRHKRRSKELCMHSCEDFLISVVLVVDPSGVYRRQCLAILHHQLPESPLRIKGCQKIAARPRM